MYHGYVIYAFSMIRSPIADEHNVPLNEVLREGICTGLI